VREIGVHFHIKSPNGVMCHLKALQKKGLIHREPSCLTTRRRACPPE
jgi:repressor LexA